MARGKKSPLTDACKQASNQGDRKRHRAPPVDGTECTALPSELGSPDASPLTSPPLPCSTERPTHYELLRVAPDGTTRVFKVPRHHVTYKDITQAEFGNSVGIKTIEKPLCGPDDRPWEIPQLLLRVPSLSPELAEQEGRFDRDSWERHTQVLFDKNGRRKKLQVNSKYEGFFGPVYVRVFWINLNTGDFAYTTSWPEHEEETFMEDPGPRSPSYTNEDP